MSVARIVLVCLGQWSANSTWYYDPQLAVEMSEIGATLIALSVPALKPLLGTYVPTRLRSNSSDNMERETRPIYLKMISNSMLRTIGDEPGSSQ